VIVRGDALRLPLADESVACVVTSPPYNVGMDYGDVTDLMSWAEYVELAMGACREMARVLVPGGRAWVNVMRTAPEELTNGTHSNGEPGKKGGHAIGRVNLAGLWGAALEGAGLAYRDTVVWVQDSHDGACSWGSWEMPSAPNLRGDHEVILLFHKGPWLRTPPYGAEKWRDKLGNWETLCRNVWTLQSNPHDSHHPAPFPAELPRRCIRLSTWPGEVVLDPFAGTGTTLRVAEQLERVPIGIELSRAYCERIIARGVPMVLL
jgi:site-specific DNA-methyltransferase (adenine-specific)